jgi:hypothetical protein
VLNGERVLDLRIALVTNFVFRLNPLQVCFSKTWIRLERRNKFADPEILVETDNISAINSAESEQDNLNRVQQLVKKSVP